MQVKSLTNLFLFLFAAGALWLLFKYTNVIDIGFRESFDKGIQNVKRIIQEKTPSDQMSEAEKEKVKKALGKNPETTPLYCQSTYFPFVSGANWSYRVSIGKSNDIIKIGIPSPEGEKYFLDGRLVSREKWTNRTVAVCQGNKIRLTDLNFLLIFKRDRTITTPCSQEQYSFSLPSDDYLVQDNAWSEKGCLVHTVLSEDYQEKESETKEELEVRGRVLGRENISVPAGIFDAVKIELDLSGRQEISGGAKRVDSVINIWMVQGVGIVKTVYSEKDDENFTVTQELTGFQIPTERENKKLVK